MPRPLSSPLPAPTFPTLNIFRSDPAKRPHAENIIDIAIESTGFFTDRASAQKHIDAGAKRVLISAPSKGVDLTVCYGVNHEKLTAEHTIVSNASCPTNCQIGSAPFRERVYTSV